MRPRPAAFLSNCLIVWRQRAYHSPLNTYRIASQRNATQRITSHIAYQFSMGIIKNLKLATQLTDPPSLVHPPSGIPTTLATPVTSTTPAPPSHPALSYSSYYFCSSCSLLLLLVLLLLLLLPLPLLIMLSSPPAAPLVPPASSATFAPPVISATSGLSCFCCSSYS